LTDTKKGVKTPGEVFDDKAEEVHTRSSNAKPFGYLRLRQKQPSDLARNLGFGVINSTNGKINSADAARESVPGVRS